MFESILIDFFLERAKNWGTVRYETETHVRNIKGKEAHDFNRFWAQIEPATGNLHT